MNKVKLLILICSIPFMAFSQEDTRFPIDPDTKLLSYQGVVQQAGTQDELYIRGIEWLNSYYKNPFDVCKVRNRESGVIELRHRIEIKQPEIEGNLTVASINYELKLEFKPGRYRYTITNMTLSQASRVPAEKWLNKNDQEYSPLWDDYLKQLDAQIMDVINNLKQKMQPVEAAPEEKW